MPLISQQAVVHVTANSPELAAARLEEVLSSYPDCRIVSISSSGTMVITLFAVIETV